MMAAPAESVAADLAAAARFLDLIAEGEAVTFQTFDDTDRKRPALARILHGDLDTRGAELVRLNQRGAGIFWMVNFGDGAGRKAANVTGIRAAFVDLDGAPAEPLLTCPVEPHAIVESSPGRFHAYWLLADCDLPRFGPLQRALARKFSGDPSVDDLPRVMRLPGFVHRKGKPFTTRILQVFAGQPYPITDLISRLRLSLDEQRSAPSAQQSPGGPMFAAGGRNRAMASLAGKLRRAGLSQPAIEAALLHANVDRCRPPLGEQEVRAIARSIGRYEAGAMQAAPEAPPAESATWPEPLLPGAVRVPDIPAIVIGDGWLHQMAEAVAAHTQTPEAMSVLTLVSVLAAVLQRRFEVAPYGAADEYREPLSIWTVIALGSGNRKTAVHKAMTSVLVDWEKRERDRLRRDIARVAAQRDVIGKRIETLKAQAGKEQDAAARHRLQDEIAAEREQMPAELWAPRLFSGDITSERLQGLLVEQDERAAVITDEGGIFQIMGGAYSGGLSSIDVFLQGHSGSAMRVDRAGRMAHLDRPALTLALALQPGILQDVGKTKRFRDSGLMARCLYGVPRSALGTRDVRDRRPIPPGVRARYESAIFGLLDDMRRPIGAPRVLPFMPDATEAWLDLCQRVEHELGDGGRFAHFSDWAAKLPGAAARIAGLLALAEHGTDLAAVPMDAVQRAVRLAELLIPHAEAAFALMGAADQEGDAQAVLGYIERHRLQSVARRELQKALEGRFRALDRLLGAIKLLQEWNILGGEVRTKGAGRPSIYYLVNPRLFVDMSLESHRSDLDPSSSSQIQS